MAIAAFLAKLTFAPTEAAGTVAEQRARLPPPAECDDPIEGKWKSLVWTPRERAWYSFTLDIHKVFESDSLLEGTIYVHSWTGEPDESEPGPCTDFGRRYHLTMEGAGSYSAGTEDGGDVHFGGTSYELDEVMCGWFGAYNLDQFRGTIDPEIQEFQSLNNDGGEAIDEPTVFRRIKCWDYEPDAKLEIEPPPLFPKRRSGGCSAGR